MECEAKFVRMYNVYRSELSLFHQPRDYTWCWVWANSNTRNGLFYRVKEVIERLRELRDRAEGRAGGKCGETSTKDFYEAKEISKMAGISRSYFAKLKAEIENFPEPTDTKIPHRWTADNKNMILSLITNYRESHPRRFSTKPKKSKRKSARRK